MQIFFSFFFLKFFKKNSSNFVQDTNWISGGLFFTE